MGGLDWDNSFKAMGMRAMRRGMVTGRKNQRGNIIILNAQWDNSRARAKTMVTDLTIKPIAREKVFKRWRLKNSLKENPGVDNSTSLFQVEKRVLSSMGTARKLK
jgi:hypothetical protein